MATPFNSFNASALGAFRQSTLKARGSSARGSMFTLAIFSGTSQALFGTTDRVNWTQYTTYATGGYLAGIIGSRVLFSTEYSDPPYTTLTAMTGSSGFSSIVTQPTVTPLGLVVVAEHSSGRPRPAYSTDNGASWTLVTTPASSTSGYSINPTMRFQDILKLSSGRLVAMARANNGTNDRNYPIYSDDDGLTWNGGPIIATANDGATPANFMDASGNFCILSRSASPVRWTLDPSTLVVSATVGASLTGLDVGNIGATTHAKLLAGGNYVAWVTNRGSTGGGAEGNINSIRSTDAFDNITAVSDYGRIAQDADGTLWTFNPTDDKLYSSVDGATWTLFAPTVLNAIGRVVISGMLL